jgi:hypothetical protein
MGGEAVGAILPQIVAERSVTAWAEAGLRVQRRMER